MEPAPRATLPIAARNALAHLLIAALRDARQRAAVDAAVEVVRLPVGSRLPVVAVGSAARRRACRALLASGLLRTAETAGDDRGEPSREDGRREDSGAGTARLLERVDPPWAEVACERLERYFAVLPRTSSGEGVARALEQARALFAAELDFEVHEILEGPWQTAAGRDRAALQGLIQAAVAWAHWRAGNRAGAFSLARAAAEKLLADGRESWHGLAVAEVGRAAQRWAEWIEGGAVGDPPARPFAAPDRG